MSNSDQYAKDLRGRMDSIEVSSDFRLAMRRLASAVAVVSCANDNGWLGMTATSVTSLSMDPPSVLVCVNRNATIRAAIAIGNPFTINVLERGQEAIASAFGGKATQAERFNVGLWVLNSHRVPVLTDAVASIDCIADAEIEYGSHTIVVGKVCMSRLSMAQTPLIYANGQYQ